MGRPDISFADICSLPRIGADNESEIRWKILVLIASERRRKEARALAAVSGIETPFPTAADCNRLETRVAELERRFQAARLRLHNEAATEGSCTTGPLSPASS